MELTHVGQVENTGTSTDSLMLSNVVSVLQGISQPPKSVKEAPSFSWTEYKEVFLGTLDSPHAQPCAVIVQSS